MPYRANLAPLPWYHCYTKNNDLCVHGYSLSMDTTEYWALGQMLSSTIMVPLQVSPGNTGPSATTEPQMYGATSSDAASSYRGGIPNRRYTTSGDDISHTY